MTDPNEAWTKPIFGKRFTRLEFVLIFWTVLLPLTTYLLGGFE